MIMYMYTCIIIMLNTIRGHWEKLKFIYKIYNGMTIENSSNIVINDTNAIITYTRFGKKYKLCVPYQRNLVSKMSSTKVTLCMDTSEMDITQQPGLPYMFTAKQLGGQGYIVYKGQDKIRIQQEDKITVDI